MTPDERKANRLYLAAEDMRETMQYLEAYSELIEKDSVAFDIHCSAILQLAIVCYCKSFMSSNCGNKADPKIELEAINVFKARKDLKELHDLLFTKRNKLIAHTEWEFHPTSLVSTYIDAGSGCTSVFRKSRKYNPCAGFDVGKFIELVSHIEEEFNEMHHLLDCKNQEKCAPMV
jgi:hypothetical protein